MGWNPMTWPSAITAAGYRGAGTVASWVGSKDYAEFLWSAGDPTYTPEIFRQAAAPDAAGRAQQSAEAHRFTDRAVKGIELNTEAALDGAKDVIDTITAAKLFKGTGLVGRTLKPMIGEMAMDWSVEGIVNKQLAKNGEAPMIKWIDRTPYVNKIKLPFIGHIADQHYANGGTPDTHPDSKFNPANHGVAPPQTPNPNRSLSNNITVGIGNAFEGMSKTTGLPFGLGSLIGAAIGALAMLANPIAGVIAMIGGALLGQTVADKVIAGNKGGDHSYAMLTPTPEPQGMKAAVTPGNIPAAQVSMQLRKV